MDRLVVRNPVPQEVQSLDPILDPRAAARLRAVSMSFRALVFCGNSWHRRYQAVGHFCDEPWVTKAASMAFRNTDLESPEVFVERSSDSDVPVVEPDPGFEVAVGRGEVRAESAYREPVCNDGMIDCRHA